jgi:hypothetical protein
MLLLIFIFLLIICLQYNNDDEYGWGMNKKKKKLCCLQHNGEFCYSSHCPSGCKNCQKNIRSYNQRYEYA